MVGPALARDAIHWLIIIIIINNNNKLASLQHQQPNSIFQRFFGENRDDRMVYQVAPLLSNGLDEITPPGKAQPRFHPPGGTGCGSEHPVCHLAVPPATWARRVPLPPEHHSS